MSPSVPSGWPLPEPMRAVPVNDPALPAGWAAQPKWDGYRALAGRWADGHVAVRSRNSSDLSGAFPEIEEAVRQLPDDTAVDCELIVWEAGRTRAVPAAQVIEGRSLSGSQVWTLSGSCMPGRRDFGGPLPPGEWGYSADPVAPARGLR